MWWRKGWVKHESFSETTLPPERYEPEFLENGYCVDIVHNWILSATTNPWNTNCRRHIIFFPVMGWISLSSFSLGLLFHELTYCPATQLYSGLHGVSDLKFYSQNFRFKIHTNKTTTKKPLIKLHSLWDY